MRWILSQSRLWVVFVLVASMWPYRAAAQLAPTGGHYAGRTSDTGHEPVMVNSSGGYGASVPLDLPTARGGLPVPLQITFGARGVGAAGVSWDVPLSYVRHDTSFAGRRPAFRVDQVPKGREQVLLSIQGRTFDLVRKGQAWVARHNAPELTLREQGGTWVLFDGQGHTYLFVAPLSLAGTGIWLLQSVSGPGGNTVQLEYEITTPALTGGSGVSVDLVRLAYNTHPNTACAKHEVALVYGPPGTSPLWLSILGDRVLARMRTLSAIDVMSRASCGGSAERLRRYELTYALDGDTQQPRLRSVQMWGRQGTAEESTPIVVASYAYGAASTSSKLIYQKTQTIALPAEVDSTQISSTVADLTVNAPSGVSRYATWQSLTDVTGDGRPDLVFPKDGKLWIARNRPGPSGSTTLGAGPALAQLSDSTFANGAFETRAATNNRFTYGANHRNVDEVWRQAIDLNGDGRVDIIDAAEKADHWVVYLNTPGLGPSGVTWERRPHSIVRLRHHLHRRGHLLDSNHIPLARRFTGRNRTVGACWISDGTSWSPFPEGWSNGSCGSIPNQLLSTGPEVTYTEWELADVNGDGFPDVVFNSSPVDLVSMGPPPSTAPAGQTANTQLLFRAQPRQGGANNVDAVLSLRGMLAFDTVDVATSALSAPVTLRAHTWCGVALWAETAGTQEAMCGIADVNGDGFPDRIENRRYVFLGTGRGFASVQLMLPGVYATQVSAQVQTCVVPEPDAPGNTGYGVGQSVGLRDLTGDGIPDFIFGPNADVDVGAGVTWRVSIGTGTGFAAPIDIEVLDSGFSFSSQQERCDGKISSTRSGLYDIDGDGKPEVVRVSGQGLDVYQLAGGARPGTPEAGRLVQVENGFGARTMIAYRSAKEDGTTPHQVPFPEIVVTSVETVGTQGLGGTLSATRYAYGGAELVFDPALDAFTLPGYGRWVELRLVSAEGERGEGRATVTDTYGLAPFASAPKHERFGRYLRAGRVRDVSVLAGSLPSDPWALLAVDIATEPRRIATTHYDWAVRLFEEPAMPGSNPLDCIEMAHPYDLTASFAAASDLHAYNVCSAHGFVYGLATDTWRGEAPPPSTSNVATRSEVREIDDFGRVLTVLHQNDRHRGDDDICVSTTYAVPVGQGSRVLSALSSRRIWDCTRPDLPPYAAAFWEYDHLPAGSVAAGFVTSHTVERRATDDGTLLGTIHAFDASLDIVGNPVTITRTREDGAVRTVTLEYDTFGLVPVRVKVEATGVPPMETKVGRDPVTLEALSAADPHQIESGVALDGFGRVVHATLTLPGGSPGVLSTVSYLGFSGTDPLGRRLVSKTFSDPVAPGTEDVAAGQTATVYLDELGRQRHAELELGTDYANQTLIVGARRYDGLGRVVFEANPFPADQDAATAYGTTYLFMADGSPSCFIRGHGPQHLTTVTDEAHERYPTCFTHTFADHQETLGMRDAASLLAGSPQTGVTQLATLTAVGRVVARSTWQNGARLEHATFTYDRLGQLTGLTRFQEAVGATNPVQSSWRFDSLGQVVEWREPESAPQFIKYSDWGELLEVRWTDFNTSPNADRRMVNTYDALGRITRREERNDGLTDPETVNEYFYDVGASLTPQVTPTHLLGRLARGKAPTGETFFSYDALGRVNARTFMDDDGGHYVEKTTLDLDGGIAALELYLPDTSHRQERVEYSYDSARRLRLIKFSDDSGSRQLYEALEIDPFGRVRKAKYGDHVGYEASYADVGRRLMNEVAVASASGSRRILYLSYDPLGRELVRREIRDGADSGPKTNIGYDALGRLSSALRTDGAAPLSSWQFTYDALGNVLQLSEASGAADATLSYRTGDRDRVCRIGYGDGGLGGTACNVVYDAVGNVVEQATRTGQRRLSHFASGNVRTISAPAAQARFRYDPFGNVQELDIEGNGVTDARRDRRYGGLIERRDHLVGGSTTSVISRRFPGPGGIIASRRGAGDAWIFHFREGRGNRFFTDATGAFVQGLEYQPYGEVESSGVTPGSALYTSAQWNGGDALAAFGLSHLGARVYDPVIGRFLSRDPLLLPRTAATTNPYAFAMNDPLNRADPTGLDWCLGQECLGPFGTGIPFLFGGPSGINPPGLYFPLPPAPRGGNPSVAYRPPIPTTFSTAPKGPQTAAGQALKEAVEEEIDFEINENFNFDTLAARGLSLEAVLERIENTPEAQRDRDEYNARLNSIGSFFAGFGDAVWFWCPGCASYARQSWGIESGDADQGAYTVGAITGTVALIVAPKPTTVIASPKANVAMGGCLGGACGGLGVCFVAGTLVATPKGKVPIEQLKLGDRVEAGNPQCADEHLADDTVTIGLEVPNPRQPSVIIRVTLARPHSWLEEHGLHDGTAWLELPEVGVSGWARVTQVGPAPREEAGEGCLVLMTVEHVASEVLKLRFETGTELEVTPTHPLFVEGSGWVPAGELTAGQLLRSDQGVVRLEAVEPALPNQRVYNIEVGLEHTYRVSRDSIWAHNTCNIVDYLLEIGVHRRAFKDLSPAHMAQRTPSGLAQILEKIDAEGLIRAGKSGKGYWRYITPSELTRLNMLRNELAAYKRSVGELVPKWLVP